MNKRTLGYWAATGLLVLPLAGGGVMNLLHAPPILATMRQLGLPEYIATIVGFWKILAVPALLVARLPRLKEWAYAGIFFNMTGAAIAHVASGDPTGKVIPPLAILALAMASWALRPASRKLVPGPAEPTAPAVTELRHAH